VKRQPSIVSSVIGAWMLGFIAVTMCRPASVPQAKVEMARDTLRGEISIVGTSFEKRTVLKLPTQSVELTADSLVGDALTRVAGLTLLVAGNMTSPRVMNVVSFVVLRAGVDTVLDGVVVRVGNGFALKNAQGTHAIGNPLRSFSEMVGARIWIAGQFGKGPTIYGVIVRND
jgi:hypothetical protein